jgi:hypothetical protein
MTIEERNRTDIINEVVRHFPHHEVRDEVDGSSETLTIYVYGQDGKRVELFSFPWREWQDHHEHPKIILAKIEKAAASNSPGSVNS